MTNEQIQHLKHLEEAGLKAFHDAWESVEKFYDRKVALVSAEKVGNSYEYIFRLYDENNYPKE